MPKRILVVEDNEDMRQLLGFFLREEGYDVVLSEDGVEGLRAIEVARPDLIITDLRMPNGDGIELIENLRANPESIELPILVVTANGNGLSHKARDAGANVIMRKPVDVDSVMDIVKELLKSSSR